MNSLMFDPKGSVDSIDSGNDLTPSSGLFYLGS